VSRDLGDFLAEGGAIVGGGAAIGATLGFIAGSLLHDFRPQTDPDQWTRNGAAVGGIVGLVTLLDRGVDFAP
jgi:hypothetical protein